MQTGRLGGRRDDAPWPMSPRGPPPLRIGVEWDPAIQRVEGAGEEVALRVADDVVPRRSEVNSVPWASCSSMDAALNLK